MDKRYRVSVECRVEAETSEEAEQKVKTAFRYAAFPWFIEASSMLDEED